MGLLILPPYSNTGMVGSNQEHGMAPELRAEKDGNPL
jgi:hypothetical protein